MEPQMTSTLALKSHSLWRLIAPGCAELWHSPGCALLPLLWSLDLATS